ncbi:SGNH/GDSL hydrolase family protein [Acidipila sp. EB88]|uniref:SGNH/GDSL hydrolase family protein n=1 Tax=Acidipila sp. EB88 TaxID=2305226 RepID=UPI001F1F98E0|nr:SGNH/GDSL hydrolase family protein [Acidipila sp. EB88]
MFLLALGPSWCQAQTAPTQWVASWAAAQQTPEPRNALAAHDYRDMTLRQIVHLSAGGASLRLKLSNAFGTAPLHLTSVHVAQARSPADSAIVPATDASLLFSGQADVTIPAGAEYWSDPVPFAAAPSSDLAISIHYDEAPSAQTGHPGSRATSYYVHGEQAAQPFLASAIRTEHWYQIAEVDVATGSRSLSVVAFGDSITDGHGATTNANDRWPDVLASRLQGAPETEHVGVVNVGIGGNRVLLDDLGPNALARFDRDVLARSGAAVVIVLEGINDLGTLTAHGEASAAQHATLVRNLLGAYQQMIDRAHAHGIAVIGGTILPDGNSNYYHPDAQSESDRTTINQWIRTPGHFDEVADFDHAVADPAHPGQLLPAFDSGDHLHPSPAGYQAMAQCVPVDRMISPHASLIPSARGNRRSKSGD